MKKYVITAHDEDCIFITKVFITARDYNEALKTAWDIFPEYDRAWVTVVEE